MTEVKDIDREEAGQKKSRQVRIVERRGGLCCRVDNDYAPKCQSKLYLEASQNDG